MTPNKSEPSQHWVNLICREWRRTSSPVLGQLIQLGRYMASTPPRLVVMSGIHAGREDDLLVWVQGMSNNFDEARIQSLNREQLMASLDVLLLHRQWAELVDFTSKMFCTIDLNFWEEFVSQVAQIDCSVLFRIAESCPPKMARYCLLKLREINWQPNDAGEREYLENVNSQLGDPGKSLYQIPFRTGKNLVSFLAENHRISVQASSFAVDPPLTLNVSVTASKTFKDANRSQEVTIFLNVGPFGYQSVFTVPRDNESGSHWAVSLQELELGLQGTAFNVRWKSFCFTGSSNRSWKSGEYSESVIVDLLSRLPPHLVTETELLQLQQTIPQIVGDDEERRATRERRRRRPREGHTEDEEPSVSHPSFPSFVLNQIFWSQHRRFSGQQNSFGGGHYKLVERVQTEDHWDGLWKQFVKGEEEESV